MKPLRASLRRGKGMKRGLSDTLVFDASVLIELVFSTKGGVKLQQAMLDGSIDAQTKGIAITELRYILCRRLGEEEANQRVKKLLASGYITVEDISELIENTARYKCHRALSLPDCFTLSLAKLLASPSSLCEERGRFNQRDGENSLR